MKKSTVKLILLTFAGILVSYFLYRIGNDVSSFSQALNPGTSRRLHIGIYIAPFIGLIYWIFARDFDD